MPDLQPHNVTPGGSSHPSRQLHHFLYRQLCAMEFVHPSGRVLDLGAGDGAWPALLMQRSVKAVALDRYPPENNAYTCRYVRSRAESLPFKDRTFDCITALHTWHWFHAAVTIRECRRVLMRESPIVLVYHDYVPAEGTPAARIELLLKRLCPDWQPELQNQVFSRSVMDLRQSGCRRVQLDEFELSISVQAGAWAGWLLENDARVLSLTVQDQAYLREQMSIEGPGAVSIPFKQTLITAFPE